MRTLRVILAEKLCAYRDKSAQHTARETPYGIDTTRDTLKDPLG